MTEFDYDVKNRKALVPSARRKKNGCYSKKCTLPSDYMTERELKKMNGEVISINFGKAYSFKELNQFPLDLQREYVQNLRTKYCMSIRMFCMMSNVGEVTASKYFKDKLGLKLDKGLQASQKQRREFRQFAGLDQDEPQQVEHESQQEEQVKESVAPQTEHKVEPKPEAPAKSWTWNPPLAAKLAYHGSTRDICEALISALGASSVGRFEIAFKADAQQEGGAR